MLLSCPGSDRGFGLPSPRPGTFSSPCLLLGREQGIESFCRTLSLRAVTRGGGFTPSAGPGWEGGYAHPRPLRRCTRAQVSAPAAPQLGGAPGKGTGIPARPPRPPCLPRSLRAASPAWAAASPRRHPCVSVWTTWTLPLRTRIWHLAQHLPAAVPAAWVASASRRLLQASTAASEAKGLFPGFAVRVQRRGQKALPLLCAAACRARRAAPAGARPLPKICSQVRAGEGAPLALKGGPRAASGARTLIAAPEGASLRGHACQPAHPSWSREERGYPRPERQVGPPQVALTTAHGAKGQGCSSSHPSISGEKLQLWVSIKFARSEDSVDRAK
ncbi:uncharacterized protein LOC131583434 [Poecile atricapillus]|uniref:uncharacterized protein LOC131583434 n=1 Tax=Poecile atricapillus TaxID=48891 RepID=UPI0027394606|nr:uncharacterized protein LOC131583434 [Poecile atricapillus]